MLHETIRNSDFKRNTALQHCYDIDWNSCNIVPTLQRCVALKIVVTNRPVQHHLLLHGTIRNDDFTTIQRRNIVATLFQMVATLFQHWNAVLR